MGPRQPARRGGAGREEPDLIRLVAVGRLRSGPEAALCAEYAKRLRPPPEVVELPDGRGAPSEIRRRERAAILAALPAPNATLVALDLGGEAASSERLAQLVERWEGLGKPLCLALGGAEGLDPAVLARADHRLSLGPMTWPHALARAMLLEQLFRAQCIRAGHPYHRAWRP